MEWVPACAEGMRRMRVCGSSSPALRLAQTCSQNKLAQESFGRRGLHGAWTSKRLPREPPLRRMRLPTHRPPPRCERGQAHAATARIAETAKTERPYLPPPRDEQPEADRAVCRERSQAGIGTPLLCSRRIGGLKAGAGIPSNAAHGSTLNGSRRKRGLRKVLLLYVCRPAGPRASRRRRRG